MSGSSDISSVLSLARPILPKGPTIEVQIDDHYKSKFYSSGSSLSGKVIINPWKDTRFDFVSIVLIGLSRTRMEAAQIAQNSSHTFLKLNMPIPESAYPTPRVFEAGHTYTIPFNFIIPQHLTLSACNHKKQSDAVYDQHMRLPPSMGHWGLDDLAPDMARIEYMIKARVAEQPELGGRAIKLMEADHHFNVLPTSIEDPPLSITPQDKGYTLSKTKTVRKNLFSAKQGKITASAAQPAAIRLQPDGRPGPGSETLLSVDLRFDPSSPEIAPPKSTSITAKLSSDTWFSAAPMASLPNMGDPRLAYTLTPQLSYSTSISLFNANVEKTSWLQQSSSISRRDSGYSSQQSPTPSSSDSEDNTAHRKTKKSGTKSKSKSKESSSSPVYHHSTIQVPFHLPTSTRKLFLPTYHTCLSSRSYTLNVQIHVGDAKINLALPVQVIVEPSAEQVLRMQASAAEGLPSFDAAMAQQQEEAAADELLRGRVVRQPAEEFQGTSALPGYDEFSLRRRVVPAA